MRVYDIPRPDSCISEKVTTELTGESQTKFWDRISVILSRDGFDQVSGPFTSMWASIPMQADKI